MTAAQENLPSDIAAMLAAAHQLQREAHLADPMPAYQQRREDLLTLKRMITENRDAIIDAISADYGNRSRHESLFAEIIAVTDGINDKLNRLKTWMKVQKRHVDQMMFPGGKNRVIPQPLGVVGIIVPWNFPANLSLLPVATAFAAGNRAMVKMSENSINLSRLFIEISPRYFPADKLRFFEETGGVGIEFSQVPFDMIMFTPIPSLPYVFSLIASPSPSLPMLLPRLPPSLADFSLFHHVLHHLTFSVSCIIS